MENNPSAKRILFVHSSNELYGSDKVLWQLVSGLDRSQFEPIVVLPTDIPYEGKLSAKLEDAGITCYCIKMGVIRRRYFNPWGIILCLTYLIYGVWKLGRLIRKHQIDIVQSNTSAVLGGALIASLLKIPHIWHVHEIITKPEWLSRVLYRFIYNNSTKVIVISQAVANCFRKCEDKSRFVIIGNGVDCTKFNPQILNQVFRDQWGVKPEEVVAGVVGRISHWKGQDLFLEAARQIAKECPQTRFAVVGSPVHGDEARLLELQTRVKEYGLAERVIFQPVTPDIPQVMQALDVLVLPSVLPEPFGLVLLEAMASERPVVAASHGGPLDIIIPGETGVFFTPNDAESLSDVLVRLIQDSEQRKVMGVKGRQRVLEHYDLSKFVQQFTRFYFHFIKEQETVIKKIS